MEQSHAYTEPTPQEVVPQVAPTPEVHHVMHPNAEDQGVAAQPPSLVLENGQEAKQKKWISRVFRPGELINTKIRRAVGAMAVTLAGLGAVAPTHAGPTEDSAKNTAFSILLGAANNAALGIPVGVGRDAQGNVIFGAKNSAQIQQERVQLEYNKAFQMAKNPEVNFVGNIVEKAGAMGIQILKSHDGVVILNTRNTADKPWKIPLGASNPSHFTMSTIFRENTQSGEIYIETKYYKDGKYITENSLISFNEDKKILQLRQI